MLKGNEYRGNGKIKIKWKIEVQLLSGLTTSSKEKENMLKKIGETKKHLGQGMTEYIIIVAVIAVAAIGAFGYFGQVVETQIAGLSSELGGGSGADARGAATDLGETAKEHAVNSENSMGNYDDNDSEAGTLGGGG
jgi:Flp pilus assembly pilin Flp